MAMKEAVANAGESSYGGHPLRHFTQEYSSFSIGQASPRLLHL